MNTTETNPHFQRQDIDFFSHGCRCSAWLYLPNGVTKPPIVIMAHGFAAEKSFRLPAFAERFTEHGMAVLAFDYRNFGDSDGTPVNLVHPFRHVQDWDAAINHVKTLNTVNSEKIALWGSSFGGGHVIVSAAKHPEITAVVSQMPYLDPITTLLKLGFVNVMKGLVSGIRDVCSSIILNKPYYIPVVADPGTYAVMNSAESKPGYLALIPENSSWENKCPARICLLLPFYSPTSYAKQVSCPTLFIAAEKDSLIAPACVEKTAAKMANASVEHLNCGHFSPYVGALFETTVSLQIKFLVKTLGLV